MGQKQANSLILSLLHPITHDFISTMIWVLIKPICDKDKKINYRKAPTDDRKMGKKVVI